MVGLPQPPAAAEVVVTTVVHAEDHVFATSHGQGHQPVGAVIAVGQQHVDARQVVQQFPHQGGLPGILAAVRPPGHAPAGRGGQGQQPHQAKDREAQSGLLVRTLWVSRLIRRCVGHGQRRAIHELDVLALPQPVRRHGVNTHRPVAGQYAVTNKDSVADQHTQAIDGLVFGDQFDARGKVLPQDDSAAPIECLAGDRSLG